MKYKTCALLRKSSSRHNCATISLSLSLFRYTHIQMHSHHLSPLFTSTDIKLPINSASIFHLKHIFTPTPLPLPVCLCLFLSQHPSFLHPAGSPGASAGEILMCSLECCCLECGPDHELCFWTVEEVIHTFRQRSAPPDGCAAPRTTQSRAPRSLSGCSMQMIHDCNVKPDRGYSEL